MGAPVAVEWRQSDLVRFSVEMELQYCAWPAAKAAKICARAAADQDRIRDAVMADCGGQRFEDESHLAAWLRTMCERNGLPWDGDDLDVPLPIVRAVLVDADLLRFVWVMATDADGFLAATLCGLAAVARLPA